VLTTSRVGCSLCDSTCPKSVNDFTCRV